MSRFNKINVQHFATLVQDIDVSKYTQEEYREAVEEIYMSIFRHNTNGQYVIETLPNAKANWRVYEATQTKEEALRLIKERNKYGGN
tara:strand:+ start:25 stop:285 length:261 start_codon:yes stop_codon:yes gene_type:complete